MRLGVNFRPSHPRQLAAFAAAVSDPHSPSYHRFLSVAQFRSRFGPSPSKVAAVDSYLRSHGLSVGAPSANGLFQPVSGSAAQVSAAFAVPLAKVKARSGAVLTGAIQAPKLPSAVAASVSSIPGLHPWTNPVPAGLQSALPAPASSSLPASTSSPSSSPISTCSGMSGDYFLSPSALASYYKLGAFYAKGMTGGTPIGLIEFSSFSSSDVSTWENCIGVKTPVNVVTVGSAPSLSAAMEPTADIEQLSALAPSSPITVYQGTSALDVWNAAVSADTTKVISSSWGICEAALSSSFVSSEASLLQEAAAQGQTVLQASGDWGAQACNPNTGASYQNTLSVWDPASQPYVTAVGGVYVHSTGALSVWNAQQAGGSSGGGLSTFHGAPSYQAGSPNPGLATYRSACGSSNGCRQVPDVSAIAGNGIDVYCTAGDCSGTGAGWGGVAGTSMAAPQWAAAVALEDQVCGSPVGFLNPVLYSESPSLPAAYLSPVDNGSNAYATSQGYSANPSGYYSPTTGLGSLGGNGATASLASGQLCSSATANGGSSAGPSAPAQMTLSAPSLSFGSMVAGAVPARATLTITNSATAASGGSVADLSLSGLSVSGTGFSVVSNGCTTPLASGSSCSLTLQFTPTAAGQQSGSLTLSSNAANSPQQVSLSANVATSVSGYYLVTPQGNTFNFGVGWSGSPASLPSHPPVVGIASSGSPGGYWEASQAGNVYNFGAAWYGSAFGRPMSGSVVGIAATPDHRGYWLVTSGGNVYNFGDASWYGSMAGKPLAAPIEGIAASPAGGYYLFTAKGNVYNFGAPWLGSAASAPTASPIAAMAVRPSGGYWLAESNGTVLGFGGAVALSPAAFSPNPLTAIVATPDGKGYWLLSSRGNVYNFGDAHWFGSVAQLSLSVPVVGMDASF